MPGFVDYADYGQDSLLDLSLNIIHHTDKPQLEKLLDHVKLVLPQTLFMD
jgi:hypothetical protein